MKRLKHIIGKQVTVEMATSVSIQFSITGRLCLHGQDYTVIAGSAETTFSDTWVRFTDAHLIHDPVDNEIFIKP